MSSASEEVVTTIYMSGFPGDFREREFENMFAFAKGYEGSAIKLPFSCPEPCDSFASVLFNGFGTVPREQILGFARFRTRQDALEACQVLNGRVISVEDGTVLKAEMAKKNLHLSLTRSRSALSAAYPSSENTAEGLFGPNLARRASVAGPVVYSPGSYGSGEEGGGRAMRSLSLSIPGNPTPVPVAAPHPPARDAPLPLNELAKPSAGLLSVLKTIAPPSSTSPGSAASAGTLAFFAEHPPCNTLYVGNLPLNASEIELRHLFSRAPGYRRMSFKPKLGGSPMCFIEFEDIGAATSAMENLYGTLLSNSTKGGIRLSYSKNPLGVRSTPPISAYLGGSLFADLFLSTPDIAYRDFPGSDFPKVPGCFQRFMDTITRDGQ